MPLTIYFTREENESAKQFAYRTLRRNILLLEMKPGEIIKEREICSKLSISRTPVREALLELCRERLVEIYPQKGTRVALMDARLVDQGRFLRETVEPVLLELACKLFTQEHYDLLKQNVLEQEEAAKEGDFIKFFLKDNEFHRILFTVCRKEMVYDAMGFFQPHFTRERMLRMNMFNTEELLTDHHNILEALKSGDCRKAQLHLIDHLDAVMCDQQFLIEGFPEYFIKR